MTPFVFIACQANFRFVQYRLPFEFRLRFNNSIFPQGMLSHETAFSQPTNRKTRQELNVIIFIFQCAHEKKTLSGPIPFPLTSIKLSDKTCLPVAQISPVPRSSVGIMFVLKSQPKSHKHTPLATRTISYFVAMPRFAFSTLEIVFLYSYAIPITVSSIERNVASINSPIYIRLTCVGMAVCELSIGFTRLWNMASAH